jgi:hypothetical protein
MKRLTLGLSAAALAIAGAAFAAEGNWDRHAGQTVTRAEAQAKAEQAFAKLDVNHDGKLDQADRAARMTEIFDRIDTNHDGMISRAEFNDAHQHMMGDHRMGDHPDMDGDHRDRDGMGHDMGHGRHGMGMMMFIMHQADPNHTGVITRDAFVGAALALFDKADTNHDGKVTPQERHAARRAMGEAMHDGWRKDGGPGGDMPPPPPAR